MRSSSIDSRGFARAKGMDALLSSPDGLAAGGERSEDVDVMMPPPVRPLVETGRVIAEIEAHARAIHAQAKALVHTQSIFGRASARAGIGVWECDLADESLNWTDGTYDLFELPRGSTIERARILDLYDAPSLAALTTLRMQAIQRRGPFDLDARIRTAQGNERWIRITADVDCVNDQPVRLFGLKQDITEQRMLVERLRVFAECDPLTRLANRGALDQAVFDATRDRDVFGWALVLIDLDGFKQINDTFGHAVGDAYLRRVAVHLRAACGDNEVAARMGGDEFALVIDTPGAPLMVQARVERILRTVRQPFDIDGLVFRPSASIGVAIWRGGGENGASKLFVEADMALYAAKGDGKNTARLFTSDLEAAAAARFASARRAAWTGDGLTPLGAQQAG